MATGDKQDFVFRIKAVLPKWFGDDSPVLDALINGFAFVAEHIYELFQYAKLQTRIKTATDGWLDMISADFFGNKLPRKANQSDASFRARIIANMFRERGTRNSIIKVLEDLTGRTPLVFEPLRGTDTGGYNLAKGYGFGAYGSVVVGPFQGWVTAFRPLGSGIPMVAGYGISTGGYSQPSRAEYASLDMIQLSISDADIYEAVESVKPAGTVAWVQISN